MDIFSVREGVVLCPVFAMLLIRLLCSAGGDGDGAGAGGEDTRVAGKRRKGGSMLDLLGRESVGPAKLSPFSAVPVLSHI